LSSRPVEKSDLTPAAARKSGAVAALLSALFPGLGQAYLGQRKTALIYAAPVVALIGFVGVLLGNRSAAVRILDPTIAFVLMGLVIVYGIWWIGSILNAWRDGEHRTVASVFVALVLVLAVGSADAWSARELWRVHNAAANIFTGNPLDVTPPPPAPTPTPTPVGATPDPQASPTRRPPDYVDPQEEPSSEPTPTIEPGATPEFDITTIDAHDDGLLNVLLAGLDWKPGRDSKRTDTILVVSANSETGEVLMFSFPRDTARFPLYNGGTYHGKINTFAGFANRNPDLYPEGGLRSLAFEVGYLLGIPIDYYASVDMPGFMSVVELVGGVTVNNTSRLHDDTLQFYLEPGTHHLNAADTLRYVRSRHGSGGDFARNERQQQVLAALRRELLKPENLARIGDIAEALSQVISTDFPPEQIDQLLQLADTVEAEPSQSWVFKYPQWATYVAGRLLNGRSITYFRMDRIAALSIELFGEKSLWNGKKVPPPPIVMPDT